MVIEDQFDYVQGGVQLTLTGRILDGRTMGRVVSNRISTSFTNDVVTWCR